MSSPLIISGGAARQLGTGSLEVNTIEPITGTSLSLGNVADTINIIGVATIAGRSGSSSLVINTVNTSDTVLLIEADSATQTSVFARHAAGGNGGVVITPTQVRGSSHRSIDVSGGPGSTATSGSINIFSGTQSGVFASGDVNIFTSNVTGAANAGDVKVYTGLGQTGTQAGGIVIEANGGSTITPVDRQIDISCPLDIRLTARGGSITLNQSGNTVLSGFTATSIVGALNELKSGTGSVAGGAWTPTFSNIANSSGVSLYTAFYVQSGNGIYFKMEVNVAGTTNGLQASFEYTIPVARSVTGNFVDPRDILGRGFSSESTEIVSTVAVWSPASQRGFVSFTAVGSGGKIVQIDGMYKL